MFPNWFYLLNQTKLKSNALIEVLFAGLMLELKKSKVVAAATEVSFISIIYLIAA